MRRKTYLKIINALREGVYSKRGIQDHSGLSWGSCSPVINHLLAQKMIVAEDLRSDHKNGKGRKTRYFNFSSNNFLIIGMEIESTAISSCVTTFGNDLIGHYRQSFSQSLDNTNIGDHILQAFESCCATFQISTSQICVLSLSLSGAIDVGKKIWRYSPRTPGISDFDFSQLEGKPGFPENIFIQHDIHAFANSIIPSTDLEDGDYVFVHVGEGIAMSANIGGIIYGSRGFAGEIGHIPYAHFNEEVTCSCGNKNCLETVLNSSRILRFIESRSEMESNTLSDSEDQDIRKRAVHERILPPLVYLATIISNIFDPRRIIIGGSVLEPFYNYLIEPFEQQLREMAWINGPSEICWYRTEDMDGAYGSILHSGDRIVQGIIDQIDLDHHQ